MSGKICPLLWHAAGMAQMLIVVAGKPDPIATEDVLKNKLTALCLEDKCAWWTLIGCGIIGNATLARAKIVYSTKDGKRTTTYTVEDQND